MKAPFESDLLTRKSSRRRIEVPGGMGKMLASPKWLG